MTNSTNSSNSVSDRVETLKLDRDRFVRLAFCSADVLLEVDSEHVIKFAAGASQYLTGMAPESLIGKPFIELIAPDDALLMSEIMVSISPGARLDPFSVRFNGETGRTAPIWLSGYRIPDAPGDYLFGIRIGNPGSTVTDISEDLQDPESGLLKKEAFAEFADKQIREASERGEVLRMTMLHTDEFEDLRSRMDPEDAQNAFKSMGACLKANAVGGQAAGQFNDNAYGFLHKSSLDVEQITKRVEDIFEAADPTGAGISVEKGTIEADIDSTGTEDSVRVLLYTVNQFCEKGSKNFDMSGLAESLKAMTSETSTKLSEFRDISRNKKFEIAFQPIVALDTRAIHHYEVLARLEKKIERSPYEMLSFAESTGIIAEFDLAMTKHVVDFLKQEKQKGRPPALAVNLSGQSITNADFVASLQLVLKSAEDVRSHLIFEITESSHIDDLEVANRAIQALRDAGHKVCLDDFGAGSAALRYLHALEVDVVKIDGKYVRSAMESPRNRSFLRAISLLCRELDVETIAEFIEDEDTATMLIDCQVQFGQGYLYGKPSFDITEFSSMPVADEKSAAAGPEAKPVPGGKLKAPSPARPDIPGNGVQMILPDKVAEASKQRLAGKKRKGSQTDTW